MAPHQSAEAFDGESRDRHPGVDDGLAECFGEVALADSDSDSDRLQHLRAMLPCEVRVVAETHPLFGRPLSAVSFRRRGSVLLLVVTLPDGSPGTVRAQATNVFGGDGTDADADMPQLVLTNAALRALRRLVDQFPTSPNAAT